MKISKFNVGDLIKARNRIITARYVSGNNFETIEAGAMCTVLDNEIIDSSKMKISSVTFISGAQVYVLNIWGTSVNAYFELLVGSK